MSAPDDTAAAFWPQQPVRLLVGYLAPAVIDPSRPSVRSGRKKPADRFLMPSERLTFRRYRPEKPGSVVVADSAGRLYFAPEGFLAAVAPSRETA